MVRNRASTLLLLWKFPFKTLSFRTFERRPERESNTRYSTLVVANDDIELFM